MRENDDKKEIVRKATIRVFADQNGNFFNNIHRSLAILSQQKKINATQKEMKGNERVAPPAGVGKAQAGWAARRAQSSPVIDGEDCLLPSPFDIKK